MTRASEGGRCSNACKAVMRSLGSYRVRWQSQEGKATVALGIRYTWPGLVLDVYQPKVGGRVRCV